MMSHISFFCRQLIICMCFCLCCTDNIHALSADSVMQTLNIGTLSRDYKSVSDGKSAFLLSGKSMYETGCINGSFFDDVYAHVEHGIWCHPVKLISSIDCSIIEEDKGVWSLNKAVNFKYNFYSAEFEFENDGLKVLRRDVVAENHPALCTTFSIENRSNAERLLTLRFVVCMDIRPSQRCVGLNQYKCNTTILRENQAVIAYNEVGAVMIGNGKTSGFRQVADSLVELEYKLSVPSGKTVTSFPLLIVGDNKGDVVGVRRTYHELVGRYDDIYAEKSHYYNRQLFDGVRLDCSDYRLTDAFYCAKANVLLNICNHSPYIKRPFVRAGVPVYPRLFGTDFCFSVRGLLASCFEDIVKETLLLMAAYTKEHMRAPHEISSDGILLGWDHIQVSPQWIAACLDYYVWSHDLSFLEEVYPLCTDLLKDILSGADSDKDGFIEGHGLMEESEFKADWEELSAASYTYTALKAVSIMADIMHDIAAPSYKDKVAEYRKHFNDVWWNDEESVWNCAFTENNEPRPYNFWSVAFPQSAGVASGEKGLAAMNMIEKYWVNSSWGMVGRFRRNTDQTNEGVGLVHNNLCSVAAFKYGKGELGWNLLQLTTKGVFDLENTCLGLFPECQPGLCSNISQLWSYSTFLESVLTGLAGISPDEETGVIEISPFFPATLSYLHVENIRVGDNVLSMKWKRTSSGRIRLDVWYTGDVGNIMFPDKLKRMADCRIHKSA